MDVIRPRTDIDVTRRLAKRLYITEPTVEDHLTRILAELRVSEGPDVHRRVLAALTLIVGGQSH